MKNRNSTLRKAVMAAMLAGAITTTGGVKAKTKNPRVIELLTAVTKAKEAKDDSQIFDRLASIFSSFTSTEMVKLLSSFAGDKDDSEYGVVDKFIGDGNGDAIRPFFAALIDGIGTQIEKKEELEGETVKLRDELSRVKNNSSDLMSQLNKAFKISKELADYLSAVEKDKARAIQISGELADKLSQAESERDNALSESADLANKLSVAQAEADRLSQAVDSLGRLTEGAKRELTEKLAEIDQLTQDKAKAASDLETANANITTLQEELAGAKANVDKLSEEKAAADQALADANARVSELEQEVAAANNRVADLEAQLAEKTAELDVVKADKAELEAKVKELQGMLQQKDRSNADLQANIERLKQELADKFKDQAQPRAKTPQASNSVTKQKASKPTAKPAGQLPSTGEATANPFFTAAAVAIMTGAGLVTVMPKRQKN